MKAFAFLILLFHSPALIAQADKEIELQHDRIPLQSKTDLIMKVDFSHFHEELTLGEELQERNYIQTRKIGLKLWDGKGELIGVVGALKNIHSQKLLQRRPYVELSLFPWVGPWGQLLQYNIVKLPFSDTFQDEELAKPYRQGTEFTVGIAPTLMWRHRWKQFAWDLSLALTSGRSFTAAIN